MSPLTSHVYRICLADRMQQAEESVVRTFQRAILDKTDLKQAFEVAFEALRETCFQVANNIIYKKGLGLRRDHPERGVDPYIVSPVKSSSPHSQRTVTWLQSHLPDMNYTARGFQHTARTFKEGVCLGRAESTEIAIYQYETVGTMGIFPVMSEYEKYCKLCNTPMRLLLTLSPMDYFKDLACDRKAMQTLKTASLEDYNKLKRSIAIQEVLRFYPGIQSTAWIVATRRLQVDNKMVAISQCIASFNGKDKMNPIAEMSSHSRITICHQDPFLIPLMLSDVAKVFQEALSWNRENLFALKERMALFEYELLHALPLIDGSVTLCHSFVKSIYRFHSFKAVYRDEEDGFQVLTSTLNQFVQDYDQVITLEPISELKG